MTARSPFEVVKSERRIAWLLFLALFAGYIVYVVLAVSNAISARNDPPTSTNLETITQSSLPLVYVCAPFNAYNQNLFTEFDCAFNGATDLGCKNTSVVLPLSTPTSPPSSTINCVKFSTNSIVEDTNNEFTLQAKSTTFTFQPNFPMVLRVLITESELTSVGSELSDGSMIDLPSNKFSVLFLGRQIRTFLDKDDKEKWTINGVVHADVKDKSPSDVDAIIQLQIPQLQVLYIEETDPLDVYDLLGSVAGFWSYTTLFFALFFLPVRGHFDSRGVHYRCWMLLCCCSRFASAEEEEEEEGVADGGVAPLQKPRGSERDVEMADAEAKPGSSRSFRERVSVAF